MSGFRKSGHNLAVALYFDNMSLNSGLSVTCKCMKEVVLLVSRLRIIYFSLTDCTATRPNPNTKQEKEVSTAACDWISS